MLNRLPTRCRFCKERFSDEDRALHRRIHPACIPAYAEAQEAKAKRKAEKQARMAAKVERALDRQARERMKSIAQLIAAAQVPFNAFIRERDRDQPCVCCGRTGTDVSGLYSHGWDAGHYRSTGSASHLRFHEDNCHRQLVYCNRHGAGRAVDYRIGLIARIGLDRVEALEADNTPKKWTREELIAIKATYASKLKAIKEKK